MIYSTWKRATLQNKSNLVNIRAVMTINYKSENCHIIGTMTAHHPSITHMTRVYDGSNTDAIKSSVTSEISLDLEVDKWYPTSCNMPQPKDM